MIISNTYCISELCVRHAYLIWAIIPVTIILIIFMKLNFIKFTNKEDKKEYQSKVKLRRILIALSRIFIFALLLVAISSPHIIKQTMVQGDTSLLILADNTTSFEVFDKNIPLDLAKSLEGGLPVNLRAIGTSLKSNIGDGILNNIQGNDNILVVTDGNNNKGKSLIDMVEFASSINSTIHTVDISPTKTDIGVSILGTPEQIVDADDNYDVIVNNIGNEVAYHILIMVDDTVYLDQDMSGSQTIRIKKAFSGVDFHTITAEITNPSEDLYPQNNAYYKTIKIYSRPSVLFVSNSENTPLFRALNKIYDLTTTSEIPSDLSNYLSIILNDIPASILQPKIDQLTDYISNGNGIIFIGGENSYERSYKGTLVETLLPVTSGAGEDSEDSDVNIVIAIDRSQGTAGHLPLMKSQAISVIESLDESHNVGVIAFSAPGGVSAQHGVISDISPLSEHKNTTIWRISRLTLDGQSPFDYGLNEAFKMLRNEPGSRNIIFISDGQTTNEALRQKTRDKAIEVASMGTKIYTVGAGTDSSTGGVVSSTRDDQFLSQLALFGNGMYFPINVKNKLNVLFGESQEDKEFLNSLVLLDTYHFITRQFSIDATVTGYNFVIPKPSARLLVSTNKKIPILTVWRFGLGRIAAFSTDDGSKWSGDLLKRNTSELITRTVNWAIGDLTRKSLYDVSILDTTINEPSEIIITSIEPPISETFDFRKEDVNKYVSEFSSEQTGIYDVMDGKIAINYYKEYMNLGVNPSFIRSIENTGGKIFNLDDTENILNTIKTQSKKPEVKIVSYSWIFALLALLLLLFEIIIRRLNQYRVNRGE